MHSLFVLFAALRLAQQAIEHLLARLNLRYALDPVRRGEAGRVLAISDGEMEKALAYAGDRHRLGRLEGWAEVLASLGFIGLGGLGLAEGIAGAAAGSLDLGPLSLGLAFLGLLGLLGALFELPFDLYHTFVIEERHGFNRQTPGGFFLDRLKGLALAVILGGPLVALVLWIMARMGTSWWLWAWGATALFSVFTAWMYPTLIAPLFNKFTPLGEGELRDEILALARHVGFRAGGLFVMDASRRTAHGNAYFTGLFGRKRIVLFDTLLESLAPRQVVAVLAHELGHFQLHHVRWALLRSVLWTGLLFFALSRALPLEPFYAAFGLGRSSHAALVVFGAWFSLVAFVLQPIESALSRRHEFAADAFALRHGATASELGAALLRLRESSRLLPLAHPLYSRVYHSHPPLLERLRALGAIEA
jgi:STE24 endopeptidase